MTDTPIRRVTEAGPVHDEREIEAEHTRMHERALVVARELTGRAHPPAMRNNGVERIVLVTAPGKEALLAHADGIASALQTEPLGLGDAVLEAVGNQAKVVKLAVHEIPRSGPPEALIEKYGISASHIVNAVKRENL